MRQKLNCSFCNQKWTLKTRRRKCSDGVIFLGSKVGIKMDIKELATRYSTSEQAMRKYLRQHQKRLNANGEHVKRVGRTWQVDDEGVRLLDELRGYEEPATIIERRDEREELRAENRRLMQLLMASQSEVIRLQRELLQLREPEPSWLERLTKLFRKK